MELFSEIYGCYYNVMAKVLEQAAESSPRGGLTPEELERIVAEHAFAESSLHLIPRLLSGEWMLLRKCGDGRYLSRLANADTSMPLTMVQKVWLKALLADRRIRLFVADADLERISDQLREIEPLFQQENFHLFDAATDGDDYTDEGYIARFRLALTALKRGLPLRAHYKPPREAVHEMDVLPQRMLYSAKDDKFRLECWELFGPGKRQIILNMARLHALAFSNCVQPDPPADVPPQAEKRWSVNIAITNARNALERCMLQFAAYDKQTVWDEATGRHICEIFYSPMEETELLIRLLSFGPVIEVLGPERFLRQIRQRVRRQLERMK